jgi:hypothetical protein
VCAFSILFIRVRQFSTKDNKMPQYMRLRNKHYVGPQTPRVASKGKRHFAEERGKIAWVKYGKSLSDNPYRPGLENDAWRKGFLQAAQFNHPLVEISAPEGLAPHKDSYVVVKRTGSTKRLPAKTYKEPRANPTYLGYTKPGKDGRLRKFRVWTSNPSEDDFKDKIASKSQNPERIVVRKEKWVRV